MKNGALLGLRRNYIRRNGLLLVLPLLVGLAASSRAETDVPVPRPCSLRLGGREDSTGAARLPDGGSVVRSLCFHRDNIFSPDDPHAGQFYARLANALHRVTAERVIRRGLYFREGDTLRAVDLEASLRRLRAYPFLHADVAARVTGGEDSVDVHIRTRDTWSARPEFTFNRRGDLLTWSAALRDQNLAGLGKDVQLQVGQTEDRTYWGAGYGDWQLLGTPLALFADVWQGSEVDGVRVTLVRPRERIEVPWTLETEAYRYRGAVIDHRGGLEGPEYHADLRRLDVAIGPRILQRGSRALWLMPAVHIDESRYAPAADLEGWRGGAAGLGTAGAAERLRERTRRVPGLAIAYLDARFSLWSDVATLERWEDVNLGATARLMVGAAMDEPGSGDAAYWQLAGEHGLRLGARRYAILNVDASGLLARGRARDARVTAGVRYYDRLSGRHTLALRLSGDRARDLAPQEMPTMGVERGLRGFDAYRFWGERLVLASLEDRLWLVRDFHGLVSAGVAGFVDGGLAWLTGGHASARPRVSAGAGLRLQSSRVGRNVVTRIDLARPVAGGEPGDGWVLTVAAGQAF